MSSSSSSSFTGAVDVLPSRTVTRLVAKTNWFDVISTQPRERLLAGSLLITLLQFESPFEFHQPFAGTVFVKEARFGPPSVLRTTTVMVAGWDPGLLTTMSDHCVSVLVIGQFFKKKLARSDVAT